MKAKLLSLIRPLPSSAILAADLETFRESIYTIRAAAEPEPFLPSPSNNKCSWCGIWQPLPSPYTVSTGELGNQPTVATNVAVATELDPGELGNQPSVTTVVAFAAERDPDLCIGTIDIPGELGNQPTVATNVAVATELDPGELGNQPTVTTFAAVAAVSDPDKNKGTIANPGELGNQPTVATYVAVAAESDPGELGNQPTVATLVAVAAVSDPDKNKGAIAIPEEDFLEPTLCNAVSQIRYSRHEQPMDRQLRKQRAAALTARWAGRSFTGLAWLDE